jgi:hypothetical protein
MIYEEFYLSPLICAGVNCPADTSRAVENPYLKYAYYTAYIKSPRLDINFSFEVKQK